MSNETTLISSSGVMQILKDELALLKKKKVKLNKRSSTISRMEYGQACAKNASQQMTVRKMMRNISNKFLTQS